MINNLTNSLLIPSLQKYKKYWAVNKKKKIFGSNYVIKYVIKNL